MTEYTPIIEQEDVFRKGRDDDTHINTIKLLASVSVRYKLMLTYPNIAP